MRTALFSPLLDVAQFLLSARHYPPIHVPEQVAQARAWISAEVPKAEVARRLEVGRVTLYSYLKS